MRILVINPGATSTKVSVFDDEKESFKTTIEHSSADIAVFDRVIDQASWRMSIILSALAGAGYRPSDFQAVCGRGGLLRHIPSGTYAINDKVIADLQASSYGEHAANLGPILAKGIADSAGLPAFFVDPVSVDEFEEVARFTGFKGMERQSFFHALNQKSIARKAAKILGKAYEELNLVVVHLGGGVSVAAHKKGRVVDVNNVKDEGCFSMDRAGGLPVNQLIDFCFSGKSKAEIKKILGAQAGVFSYLGTRDFRDVEKMAAEGNSEARMVIDAMAYQLAKDIGTMTAVLRCEVDAIVLTGGMANSVQLCKAVEAYVGKLAKFMILPGEEEMRALAEGALRALRGEAAKEY